MSENADLQTMKVQDLVLDSDNPRFFHLKHQLGRDLTQEEIIKEVVENDEDFPALVKTIQKNGVKDPIWVLKRKGGKYIVLEGNRRTVVLFNLLKENIKPPPGVRYDEIQAFVLAPDTPPVEQLLQKARLQTGKKTWGPFSEAALTYQLRQPPHLMEIDDIATDLKISNAKVKERIENYKLFLEYSKETGDDNPKRFTYFADCPAKVREWFQDNPKHKASYFKLISPKSGDFYKIKSVATRGGLRDFAQILDDNEALDLLLKDPHVTVEDALEIAKDNNVTKGMPFIKKLGPLAMSLRALDNEKIEKLRSETRFKVDLKSLRQACEEVLKKMDSEK